MEKVKAVACGFFGTCSILFMATGFWVIAMLSTILLFLCWDFDEE